MKKRLPVSPKEWLTHAESDLNLANLGRENKNILPEQICFHTQQAAEKSIKALLLFLKIDFPLTHDLEELIDILKTSNMDIPSFFNELGVLTPYAVETRYPGIWGEITSHDVNDAINLAGQAFNWIKNYIVSK